MKISIPATTATQLKTLTPVTQGFGGVAKPSLGGLSTPGLTTPGLTVGTQPLGVQPLSTVGGLAPVQNINTGGLGLKGLTINKPMGVASVGGLNVAGTSMMNTKTTTISDGDIVKLDLEVSRTLGLEPVVPKLTVVQKKEIARRVGELERRHENDEIQLNQAKLTKLTKMGVINLDVIYMLDNSIKGTGSAKPQTAELQAKKTALNNMLSGMGQGQPRQFNANAQPTQFTAQPTQFNNTQQNTFKPLQQNQQQFGNVQNTFKPLQQNPTPMSINDDVTFGNGQGANVIQQQQMKDHIGDVEVMGVSVQIYKVNNGQTAPYLTQSPNGEDLCNVVFNNDGSQALVLMFDKTTIGTPTPKTLEVSDQYTVQNSPHTYRLIDGRLYVYIADRQSYVNVNNYDPSHGTVLGQTRELLSLGKGSNGTLTLV